MINKISKVKNRIKKHKKLRQTLKGTAEKPRLSVYRSNNHIYTQIIDDVKAHTLVAASSRTVGLDKTNDVEAAKAVGKAIAEKAKAKGIEVVVFDRGGYKYHGKIKALAEAAREAGLQF
ncbi:MAG: 50S ribosomal protein L18 [Eubacteriales bacterium]|nr:50S ribosomal protein L18 [Eubacteriales bacterium]